jgi:hypothetical protein
MARQETNPQPLGKANAATARGRRVPHRGAGLGRASASEADRPRGGAGRSHRDHPRGSPRHAPPHDGSLTATKHCSLGKAGAVPDGGGQLSEVRGRVAQWKAHQPSKLRGAGSSPPRPPSPPSWSDGSFTTLRQQRRDRARSSIARTASRVKTCPIGRRGLSGQHAWLACSHLDQDPTTNMPSSGWSAGRRSRSSS